MGSKTPKTEMVWFMSLPFKFFVNRELASYEILIWYSGKIKFFYIKQCIFTKNWACVVNVKYWFMKVIFYDILIFQNMNSARSNNLIVRNIKGCKDIGHRKY